MVSRFRPVRASVGSRRVSKSTAFGDLTKDVRAQMEGIERNLARVINDIEDVTAEALTEAFKPVMEKAKEYTPVDTGKLVGSAFLDTQRTKQGVRLNMGFAAGGSPPYAVLVHENLEFFHKPPTRAKFMQLAMEEEGPKAVAALQAELRKVTRKLR